MLAPLIVAVAGPRGALAVVGAALPLVVLARWASLTRLTKGGESRSPLAYAGHAGVPLAP